MLNDGGVVNHGGAPVSGAELALEIGGRAIQTQRVNLEANGSASVSFEPVTLTERNVRASVRTPNDALARDNVFNFVMSPEEPVRVLSPSDRARRARSACFCARARVGESPRFEVTPASRRISPDGYRRLGVGGRAERCSGLTTSTTADRLARFVERGGGLLRRGWRAGRVGRAGRRAAGPSGTGCGRPARRPPARRLEYGHPAFEVFRAPRSGDFSAARFYRYRAVTAGPGAQILARFDDGAPALLSGSGNGRVLLWTSSRRITGTTSRSSRSSSVRSPDGPHLGATASRVVAHRRRRARGAGRRRSPRAPTPRRLTPSGERVGARRRRTGRARADRAGFLRDSPAGARTRSRPMPWPATSISPNRT